MPTASSAFSLLGAPQAPGNKPNLPKGVITWEEGPLRQKDISRYRNTLGQIRAADNDLRYLLHKVFFRWVRAQDRSSHAPSIPKNAYGPVGIPLIRGAQTYCILYSILGQYNCILDTYGNMPRAVLQTISQSGVCKYLRNIF